MIKIFYLFCVCLYLAIIGCCFNAYARSWQYIFNILQIVIGSMRYTVSRNALCPVLVVFPVSWLVEWGPVTSQISIAILAFLGFTKYFFTENSTNLWSNCIKLSAFCFNSNVTLRTDSHFTINYWETLNFTWLCHQTFACRGSRFFIIRSLST